MHLENDNFVELVLLIAIEMKARKIRQRPVSVADEDAADEDASEALRKSVAARQQQKDKKGSKKPLLSFDDDDEEPQIVPVKRPPSKMKPDLKGLKIASDVAKTSTQRSAPGKQHWIAISYHV